MIKFSGLYCHDFFRFNSFLHQSHVSYLFQTTLISFAFGIFVIFYQIFVLGQPDCNNIQYDIYVHARLFRDLSIYTCIIYYEWNSIITKTSWIVPKDFTNYDANMCITLVCFCQRRLYLSGLETEISKWTWFKSFFVLYNKEDGWI